MLFVTNIVGSVYRQSIRTDWSIYLDSCVLSEFESTGDSKHLKYYLKYKFVIYDNLTCTESSYYLLDFLEFIKTNEVKGVVRITKDSVEFKTGSLLVFVYSENAYKLKSYFESFVSIKPTKEYNILQAGGGMCPTSNLVAKLGTFIPDMELRNKYSFKNPNSRFKKLVNLFISSLLVKNDYYDKEILDSFVVSTLDFGSYCSVWQLLYDSLTVDSSPFYKYSFLTDYDNNTILLRLYSNNTKYSTTVNICSSSALEFKCTNSLKSFISKITLGLI